MQNPFIGSETWSTYGTRRYTDFFSFTCFSPYLIIIHLLLLTQLTFSLLFFFFFFSVCYWFSTFSSVCGYGNFVDLKTLENQESGFLVDDSLIVQVTFDVVLADTDSVQEFISFLSSSGMYCCVQGIYIKPNPKISQV